MSIAVGTRLGPYEILAPLGAGGMGEVYRARDTRLGREVAVKVLPEALSSDPERLARFEREARAVSSLNHPNVLAIHDVGAHAGVSYVVFELLEGQTLRERLLAERIPVGRAVDYGIQLARGLAAAHDKGIVHRDLKPENVFLTVDGQLKILDFGLARRVAPAADADSTAAPTRTAATEPGVVMGTPGYMSPEQIRGQPADQRSDAFSLGAVLYEMLTGERAFRGASAADTLSAILREHPPPPSSRRPEVTPALDRVVARCLEKNPAERFQSARDLAYALQESAQHSTLPSVAARSARVSAPLWASIAAGALVLLAALFATNAGGLRDRLLSRGAPHRIQSLAVLPLDNFSHDPEQEYFADGITEELITNLAQIGSVRVASRTSAMRYKGTRKSVPEIGRELDVDAVLEGSVQRAGNRVRITAQLIDAASDRHVWASSYERDLSDVLKLQADVARAIAAEIGIRLTPEERSRLARKRTIDPEAYEAYLKGLYHLYRKTPADTAEALRHFEQAAALQPDYALAHLGLSETYGQMAGSAYDLLPPLEAYPKARAAAKRAAELEPDLGRAYNSLAWIAFVLDHDPQSAENQFRRALALDPNYPDTHQTYAGMLARLSRFDEAIREMKRAQELDPLSSYFTTSVGFALHWARRHDEAATWFRRVLDVDPTFLRAHWGLGLAAAATRHYDAALPELQKAVDMSGRGPAYLCSLGYAYAAEDRRDDATRIVEELVERSKVGYVPASTVAIVLSGLGQKDQAMTWLERADRERDPWVTTLNTNFMFDPIRSDPRFQSLAHRVGLS
jgi:serine/threonine protein kinase/tetratricopeptide (TPR) repeat protein